MIPILPIVLLCHLMAAHSISIASFSVIRVKCLPKTMLTADYEAKTSILHFLEDSRTLENLFDLIYKGECEGNFQDFMDLSIAAEKYELSEICCECNVKLGEFLASDNAVQILIFAFENEFKVLETSALECVVE